MSAVASVDLWVLLRFHSRCSTVTEIAEVLEDRPVCRTERVESCLESSCRQVRVNRCHIESVLVRKGRPVTECERVPRKYCGQVPCEQSREECGHTTLQHLEKIPVETCSLQYRLQDLCVEGEEGLAQCDVTVRTVCRRRAGRRRRMKRRRIRRPDSPAPP